MLMINDISANIHFFLTQRAIFYFLGLTLWPQSKLSDDVAQEV